MSVGLGRGRGRLPQQVNGDIEPLRRPNIVANVGRGRIPVQSQVANARMEQSRSLSSRCKAADVEATLSDPKVDCTILFEVMDDFLQSDPTEEEVELFVKRAVDKCLNSKTNCDCVCKCFYLASKHKGKGDALHMLFFSILQQKFIGREGIKSTNGTAGLWRFQLLISSACQFIRHQRSPPFDEILNGLKELVVESAMPVTVEETKIAALSIARCVHYLKMLKKPSREIDLVVSKLRGLIHMSSNSDADTLLWLTLGLEACCLSSGTKLPDETVQYYCRMLGPEAAAFNLEPPPALNLPERTVANYNFSDISYIVNFT